MPISTANEKISLGSSNSNNNSNPQYSGQPIYTNPNINSKESTSPVLARGSSNLSNNRSPSPYNPNIPKPPNNSYPNQIQGYNTPPTNPQNYRNPQIDSRNTYNNYNNNGGNSNYYGTRAFDQPVASYPPYSIQPSMNNPPIDPRISAINPPHISNSYNKPNYNNPGMYGNQVNANMMNTQPNNMGVSMNMGSYSANPQYNPNYNNAYNNVGHMNSNQLNPMNMGYHNPPPPSNYNS